jgi:predicted dinucleotide-utilizing enzyme
VIPTVAVIDLDAVTAAAEGTIHSVRMMTRKPVKALVGAPYIVENNIDIQSIAEPLKIFDGTAREAARGSRLTSCRRSALACRNRPDRTRLEIWADPALTRQHPSYRGRVEFCELRDVDRKHSVRKSEDRSHYGPGGNCLSSQATIRASCWDVNEPEYSD